MIVTWQRDSGIASYDDVKLQIISNVRNELNGYRKLTENVVYTENEDGSQGVAYMPRRFPLGKFKIVAVLPKTNPYEAPEFISTDACQEVEEWTVVDGHYGEATGNMVMDYGYGLHNSTSNTTLGCGHIIQVADRAALTAVLIPLLNSNEECYLEVIA